MPSLDLTPGQVRCLLAAESGAGPDGWVASWPDNVSMLAIRQCCRRGWLEERREGRLVQVLSYRLTDTGRAVLECLWRVERHGGRSSDTFRTVYASTDKETAQAAYFRERERMRQGEVRLVAPGDRVIASS